MSLTDDEDFAGSGHHDLKPYRYLAAESLEPLTMQFDEIESSGQLESTGHISINQTKLDKPYDDSQRRISIEVIYTIIAVATLIVILLTLLLVRLYRKDKFKNLNTFYSRGSPKDAYMPN